MSIIQFNKSSSNKNKIERKFYQVWIAIKHRCSKVAKERNRYFDRGIKVCSRWKSFDYFFIDMWDSFLLHYKMLGVNTEIDRIDNDKGYYKSNCWWVTHQQNANNRSNKNLLNGKTLLEWSKVLGIKRSTLAQRHYVYRWSIDRVLSEN